MSRSTDSKRFLGRGSDSLSSRRFSLREAGGGRREAGGSLRSHSVLLDAFRRAGFLPGRIAEIAEVLDRPLIFDLPDARRDPVNEETVVGDEERGP